VGKRSQSVADDGGGRAKRNGRDRPGYLLAGSVCLRRSCSRPGSSPSVGARDSPGGRASPAIKPSAAEALRRCQSWSMPAIMKDRVGTVLRHRRDHAALGAVCEGHRVRECRPQRVSLRPSSLGTKLPAIPSSTAVVERVRQIQRDHPQLGAVWATDATGLHHLPPRKAPSVRRRWGHRRAKRCKFTSGGASCDRSATRHRRGRSCHMCQSAPSFPP